MDIGGNIKAKRIESGLTQSELAKKLGVSRTAVSSWEVNRNEPCMRDFERMSEIFGCLKTDLIGPETVDYYCITAKDERFLIEAYRSADEETKKFIQRLLAYGSKVGDAHDD